MAWRRRPATDTDEEAFYKRRHRLGQVSFAARMAGLDGRARTDDYTPIDTGSEVELRRLAEGKPEHPASGLILYALDNLDAPDWSSPLHAAVLIGEQLRKEHQQEVVDFIRGRRSGEVEDAAA